MSATTKVAVITGASHGLGEAIASQLACQGLDLALIARGKERLEAVAARLRLAPYGAAGNIVTLTCDVSDRLQVEGIAGRILAEHGRVDVLVNNAGIPAPRTLDDTGFTDWDEVIATNLSGAFYMTRALWGALRESGTGYVINISGTSGLRGSGSPAYSSAKFGLAGLTRAIAASGKPYNIRASVLYPGSMDTGWRGAPIGVKPPEETMNPQEVARYIGYLVRHRSSS
jgi:NAD(P)-dependent dehydrogenase (short-subunit alcohol dehydrogenase family)